MRFSAANQASEQKTAHAMSSSSSSSSSQNGGKSIKYHSTRGKHTDKGLGFEEVVLGGLCSDKGLFVPESIPKFTPEEIEGVS